MHVFLFLVLFLSHHLILTLLCSPRLVDRYCIRRYTPFSQISDLKITCIVSMVDKLGSEEGSIQEETSWVFCPVLLL